MYGLAGRLEHATGPYGDLGWAYDPVGNRIYESTVSGSTAIDAMTSIEAASNRIADVTSNGTVTRTFTHDAAGNLTVDDRAGTAYTYAYNARGRLSGLTIGSTPTAAYVYDALERLAIRTTQNLTPAGTTHYVYDLAGHLIAESAASGAVLREYIWLDDVPLAVVADLDTATPHLWFVHADHLDRPIRMTDAGRTVVWDAVYKPFGEALAITGSASNNLRFPGQYFLIESGLHYNWHRHYDPTLGRYIQPDPLEFVDGPSRYAYANSSPTQYFDPSGRAIIVPIVVGIAVGLVFDYTISKVKESYCECTNGNSAFGSTINAVAGGATGFFGPFGDKPIGALGSGRITTPFSEAVGSGWKNGIYKLGTRNVLRGVGGPMSYAVPYLTAAMYIYEIYDAFQCAQGE